MCGHLHPQTYHTWRCRRVTAALAAAAKTGTGEDLQKPAGTASLFWSNVMSENILSSDNSELTFPPKNKRELIQR